jgi:hypothetical protein
MTPSMRKVVLVGEADLHRRLHVAYLLRLRRQAPRDGGFADAHHRPLVGVEVDVDRIDADDRREERPAGWAHDDEVAHRDLDAARAAA